MYIETRRNQETSRCFQKSCNGLSGLASFMIHAELWLTDSPVFLYTGEEQEEGPNEEETENATDNALKGVQPFLMPREFYAVVGAGERRPGNAGWQAGRGIEKVRGCRARVLWESFAAYYGMECEHTEA